jgi:predicted kinase
LARQTIHEERGVLIVLSGLPGTGKSALADGIARTLRLPVLSVDPLESAILRAGITPSFETGLAAYLAAETLADGYLAVGLDPIIDAVNSVETAREMWRALARKHRVLLRIVECLVSDPAVHATRLANRQRDLALGEPTADDVARRRAEWTDWPEPHLALDALDELEANIAAALAYLGKAPAGHDAEAGARTTT